MSFDRINRHCSKSKRSFAREGAVKKNDVLEHKRVHGEDKHYGDTRSIEAYIKSKLKMLRKDMYIEPTAEELEKIHSLNSFIAIDNAVHSIVDRHWATF